MNALREDPVERARKYINTLDKSLQELVPRGEDTRVEARNIVKVNDAIHQYREDAEFYLKAGKPVTSLASIAYAEGLLDALKFLELTKSKLAR